MAWLLSQIQKAFEHGKDLGASHMIVAYDSFDGKNYPIYVQPGQDPQSKFPTNGDRVDEVYTYTKTWEEQASVGRVMNLDYEKPMVIMSKNGTPVHVRKTGNVEDWQQYAEKLETMLTTAGFRESLIETIRADHFRG